MRTLIKKSILLALSFGLLCGFTQKGQISDSNTKTPPIRINGQKTTGPTSKGLLSTNINGGMNVTGGIGIITSAGSINSIEGDWSSRGNGTGIYCSNDADILKEVDATLSSGKLLSETLLTKGRLRLLESWELDQTQNSPISVYEKETWESVYNRAMEIAKIILPVFMNKVEVAAKWTDFSEWVEADQHSAVVTKVEEVDPRSDLPENCRLLPIVTRYSRRAQAEITHHPQGDIISKVVFYRNYFEKLSPLDQAMLIFHEQIYLLASELGYPNSNDIRSFVQYMFTEQLQSHVQSMPKPFLSSATILFMRNEAIYIFGDYIHFFNNNVDPPKGDFHSAESHFYTFHQFNVRNRDAVSDCRIKNPDLSKLECMDQFLIPAIVAEHTTDIENFVYFAHYFADQTLHVLNADYIMNPNLSKEDLRNYTFEFCNFLNYSKNNQVFSPANLFDGAARYCSTWNFEYTE